MKSRLFLLTLVLIICLAAAPVFAGPQPAATIYIPAELTVNPLLIISVNGVKAQSDRFPFMNVTGSFNEEVTPEPGQEATYVESARYKVWVYSNAPWAARIGRTEYIIRSGRSGNSERNIANDQRLGFEYRKTDSNNWQPLNPWSLTPIWDSSQPTGNEGQALGNYQFRGVVDSNTIPGKYKFFVYFTAYQE